MERIIRMVTDKDDPVGLDRLLVMTFTNAAAAEMRERIGAAVERELLLDPDNDHLQQQAALLPQAPITTIDSFCLKLIRENFDRLSIDPLFRIGDEGSFCSCRERCWSSSSRTSTARAGRSFTTSWRPTRWARATTR